MRRKSLSRLRGLAGVALLLAAGGILVPVPGAWASPAHQSSPSITLSPATARPNESIAVTGQGFTTGGDATLAAITLGGAAVAGEKINFGKPVTIDSGGNFVTNLVVPVNSITLDSGSQSIAVTDSGGKSASASLTIAKPAISISPATSRMGSTVTVAGSNFPLDSSTIGSDEVPEVTLEYQAAINSYRRVATAAPDSRGAFSTSFTIPSSMAASSTKKQVRAILAGSSATITTTHSVLAPTIALSPAQGPAGTTVSVRGSNFEPFAPVESARLGNLAVGIPEGTYTDASGRFSASFEVPQADGGTQPVSFQVGGRGYTQTFTVEGGSTPPASETALESAPAFDVARTLRPLGDNLLRVFYFENATKAWRFYDPRPEAASFNTLAELVEGRPYWVGVREDHTPIIHGSFRTFIAGWNLIVW